MSMPLQSNRSSLQSGELLRDKIACDFISNQQLSAKRSSPTANTEENTYHPSVPTENAQTNGPPAAEEMDANPSDTAENATIEIDGQGDTVEDPIIIMPTTANPVGAGDKPLTTLLPLQLHQGVKSQVPR